MVFLHGGTVNFQANYAAFGWPEKFLGRGYQVVGLDLRGHGQSDKLLEVIASVASFNDAPNH